MSETFDIGICFEEFLQSGGQPNRTERDGRRNLQGSLRPFPTFDDARFRHIELGQNFAGRLVENFPLLRQHQSACVPVEQRNLQRFLEGTDLTADRRLAEI